MLRLSEVPPEIDLVSVFATKPEEDPDFWEALRTRYLQEPHAQGTEVVFTLWIEDFALDEDWAKFAPSIASDPCRQVKRWPFR